MKHKITIVYKNGQNNKHEIDNWPDMCYTTSNRVHIDSFKEDIIFNPKECHFFCINNIVDNHGYIAHIMYSDGKMYYLFFENYPIVFENEEDLSTIENHDDEILYLGDSVIECRIVTIVKKESE